MKTIEEESHEFAVKVGGDDFAKIEMELAFEAGAEFAQRWIPIEDNNLPEVDGKYLVLRSNGDWTSTYFQKSTNTFANYYSDMHRFTHWRPIELK